MYFIMYNTPILRPTPLIDGGGATILYKTIDDAEKALKMNIFAQTNGYTIYEWEGGNDEGTN